MKLYLVFFSAFILMCNAAIAQKENNIWYFGENGIGLDFNTVPPSVLANGQMNSFEACSSVSDENGNLLFYTDGVTVWDRNHTIMQNGSGLNGDETLSQILVLKKPGNNSLYYIFIPDPDDIRLKNGVHYSILDMNANGGLGSVISKNQVLFSGFATEHITAIETSEGCGFWVIIHTRNSTNFYSYQLSANGIDTVPIVSTIGKSNGFNFGGYMKASPDNNFLVICYADFFLKGHTELFKFNNTTGKLSDPVVVDTSGHFYSCSFSPNSRFLYINGAKGRASFDKLQYLWQYNISNYNPSSIQLSKYEIVKTDTVEYGAIQIGADNKLYIARNNKNYLAVISQPNNAGNGCQYAENGIFVGNRCKYGLPHFTTSSKTIGKLNSFGADKILCQGTPFTLDTKLVNGKFLWNTGDTTPAITKNTAGTYWIEVKSECGKQIITQYDTIKVIYSTDTVPKKLLGKDTLVCNSSFQLDAVKVEGAKYLWNTGDTTQKIKVAKTGNYGVKLTSPICKNVYSDSINVAFFISKPLELDADTTICEKDFEDLLITPKGKYTEYSWSTGNTGKSLIAKQSGKYILTVKDTCGITYTDTMNLDVCDCKLYVPNAFTPNNDDINDEYRVHNYCGFSLFSLKIFNRWGQLLFETNQPDKVWDGNYNGLPSPEGIYIVTVRYGFNHSARIPDYYGTFALMR